MQHNLWLSVWPLQQLGVAAAATWGAVLVQRQQRQRLGMGLAAAVLPCCPSQEIHIGHDCMAAVSCSQPVQVYSATVALPPAAVDAAFVEPLSAGFCPRRAEVEGEGMVGGGLKLSVPQCRCCAQHAACCSRSSSVFALLMLWRDTRNSRCFLRIGALCSHFLSERVIMQAGAGPIRMLVVC